MKSEKEELRLCVNAKSLQKKTSYDANREASLEPNCVGTAAPADYVPASKNARIVNCRFFITFSPCPPGNGSIGPDDCTNAVSTRVYRKEAKR